MIYLNRSFTNGFSIFLIIVVIFCGSFIARYFDWQTFVLIVYYISVPALILALFQFFKTYTRYNIIQKLQTSSISTLREGPVEICAKIVSSPVKDSQNNLVGFCRQEYQKYISRRRSGGYETQVHVRSPHSIEVSDGTGTVMIDVSTISELDTEQKTFIHDQLTDSQKQLFESRGYSLESSFLGIKSKPKYRLIEQVLPLEKILHIVGTASRDHHGFIIKDGSVSLHISTKAEADILVDLYSKLLIQLGIVIVSFLGVVYIILHTLLNMG